jgi:hypothetical protein
VTGVDHEFRNVSRINRRSLIPQRFTKPRKGPIASEHIQNPEILTRNFKGRAEALQKRGHAHSSIVRTLLCHVVGQATATRILILELARDDVHLPDMPLGITTSLVTQKII